MRFVLIIFLSLVSIFGKAQIIITSEQLRETNLIFLEHKQFKKQIPLLQLQIDNLEQINYSWQKTDSINQTVIYNYKNQLIDQEKSIQNLKKSANIKNHTITFLGGSTLILLLICLI